jgi:hypothetical protein
MPLKKIDLREISTHKVKDIGKLISNRPIRKSIILVCYKYSKIEVLHL